MTLTLACGDDPAPLRPADQGSGKLTASPARLDFPSLAVGDGTTQDLVITNGRGTDVTIDVVTVEGVGRTSFSARPDDVIKIAANRSKKITVTFEPRDRGDITAELVLFHNIASQAPLRVPLSGQGQACIDLDMDGFGEDCTPGPDCDDNDIMRHPGMQETCDGIDNNCNMQIDEGTSAQLYYPDPDMDTYGDNTATATLTCSPPAGYVPRNGDCDEMNIAINPGAMEICTGGVDEDCDMLIDDQDPDCAPQFCTDQDDCGLNTNNLACPLIGAGMEQCATVCRNKAGCPAGHACRPLPGSSSIGFCQMATGTASVGFSCSMASQCADGICVQGACRKICQAQDDCDVGDICGVALYNTAEFGGRSAQRLTTVCRPIGGRQPIGGLCNIDATQVDTGLCATEHCDLPPWSAQATTQARCAPICAGSADCGAGEVCGLVYNGLAETPNLPSTNEAAGRYFEAVLGCFTPYFRENAITWRPYPPGQGQLGSFCDASNTQGAFTCRSHLCAQFAPIRGRCTDHCQRDSDCVTPSTPDWKCKFGERNLAGIFLQSYDVADVAKFTLVPVCAP